jgi:protein SCO1/2
MRLVAVLLLATMLAPAAHAGAPSSIPPPDFASFAFDQHPGGMLPLDIELRGPDGQSLPLRRLFDGVPVVLDFEYDRCTTLCGVTLDRLTGALAAMPLDAGRDYRLVAIDIDLEATPREAAGFAQDHGVDRPGMTVLTGSDNAVRRLADAVGFRYRRDEATGQYAHPAGFVVATPDGAISRYFLGFDWRPLDLRLALVEAGRRRIAAPAEQLLLFCYHYDPQTGRYDLAVARLLQAVGAVTLLALAGLVTIAGRSTAP